MPKNDLPTEDNDRPIPGKKHTKYKIEPFEAEPIPDEDAVYVHVIPDTTDGMTDMEKQLHFSYLARLERYNNSRQHYSNDYDRLGGSNNYKRV